MAKSDVWVILSLNCGCTDLCIDNFMSIPPKWSFYQVTQTWSQSIMFIILLFKTVNAYNNKDLKFYLDNKVGDLYWRAHTYRLELHCSYYSGKEKCSILAIITLLNVYACTEQTIHPNMFRWRYILYPPRCTEDRHFQL